MIDKDLFPEEFAAIEKLKETSRRIEADRAKKRASKLKKIEECRRYLNAEYSERRNG